MSNPNPTIVHSISLADHNFIVQSLNKNPLGAEVMGVAALISRLNATAQAVVDVENKKLADAAAALETANLERNAKAPKAKKTAVAAAAEVTGGTVGPV